MSFADSIEERREAFEAKLDELRAAVDNENRSFTDEETTEYRDALAGLEKVAEDVEAFNAEQELRAKAATTLATVPLVTAPALVTDPEVYVRGGLNGNSYFRDLYHASKGSFDATDRLRRSTAARADMDIRAGNTTVAGAGGEFAPPLWLESDFAALARAGKPIANIVNNQPLPSGVSSINLPKVTGGSTVAIQTNANQNTAISNTPLTTSSVTGAVQTIAGGVSVAQQLIDQSPVPVDEVVLQDLASAYAAQLDGQLITSITGLSGINAVTYTDTTPTTAELLPYVQQAADAIATNRFLPATSVVMTPARWGHLLSATDTTGRPFVLPNPNYGAFNSVGTSNGQGAQDFIGTLRGLPVYLDPNIPTNLGGGSNQDEILVLRESDLWLYQGVPNLGSFPETFAANLSIFVRFYQYFAFIPGRYPASVSVISGTGMVPPAYGA